MDEDRMKAAAPRAFFCASRFGASCGLHHHPNPAKPEIPNPKRPNPKKVRRRRFRSFGVWIFGVWNFPFIIVSNLIVVHE
jgi:hypothetical protein